MLPFNITPETITVVVNGQPRLVHRSSSAYFSIRQAIKDQDWDQVEHLLSVADRINKSSNGKVTVEGGQVMYNGEPLHGMVVDQVIYFMNEGLPFDHLLKFIERLMQNPSSRARNELYGFLEKCGLTIDPDGYFLGYKAVRGDYKDYHSGKFDNSIGQVLEMPRHDVDDDGQRGCSVGFHVGSLAYVKSFIQPNGVMLIAKVDPADVVSVPYEDHGKLRTCRYEIVSHFTEALPVGPVDRDLNPIKGTNSSKSDEDSIYYETDDEFFDDGWDDEDDLDDEGDDICSCGDPNCPLY